MAKQPVADLFATLKSYTQKLSDGERTPAEIAAALNAWAQESGQSIKAKIAEEVEAAVHKMGFVKREEFDALVRQVAALQSRDGMSTPKRAPRKSAAKKTAPRKSSSKNPAGIKPAPSKGAKKSKNGAKK